MGEKAGVGFSGRETHSFSPDPCWRLNSIWSPELYPIQKMRRRRMQGMKRWHGKCENINLNFKYSGAKVQFYIRQRTKQYIWRVLFSFVPHCPDLLLLWFCTTCLLSRIVYPFQYSAGLLRWLSQHDRLSYLAGFICWELELCKTTACWTIVLLLYLFIFFIFFS